MARYIDEEALFKALERGGDYTKADILDILEDIPTAEVVEVVHCRECKHLTVLNAPDAYARCDETGYVFWSFRTDTRVHFCAYGERREG